ncbi:MAG: (Fe-S)-binding protein [Anaerolineae bacterium]|jgi:Fe-S oxidoreductase
MTEQTGQSAALEQTVSETGVFRCLECGKCTAICPISHYDRLFSPRRTVGRALMRHDEALLSDDRLWTCFTCLHCSQVCPAGVAYADLTLSVRTEARRLGAATVCTHGETIHAWMRMMMVPGLRQNRLGWLEEDRCARRRTAARDGGRITQHELRVSEDSDTLYFVGCAPYYGVLFEPLGVDGNGIARSTVQALNALGIEPQVLADERCCGHDLLWEGDEEGFRTLAELNAALIRQSGVKRIVTSCPECARALKIDYPAHGIKLDVEILHLAELLANGQMGTRALAGSAREWANGQIPQHATRVTFQDPCRLGRHMGVYDAPRQVIQGLGLELVEMQRHRRNALCCGTNGWTHCAIANKAIQVDRLREARATGADVLVTACIKCQIHLKCAMQDQQLGDEIAIEIKDLATLVAEALESGK